MTRRKVELFTAGCALCAEAVDLLKSLACPSCDVDVVSLQDDEGARRARTVGVRTVPAVAVDGVLLDCCRGGIDDRALRAAGVGSPAS